MTRIQKRKRKIRWVRCSFVLSIFTGLLYVGSATLLRGYNVSLMARNQVIEEDIRILTQQKEVLMVQIAELSSYERVLQLMEQE